VSSSDRPRFLRRVVPAAAGSVLIVIGLIGMLRGRMIVSAATILFGCFTFIGLYYRRKPSRPFDAEPESRMLLTMALTGLGVGALTLLVGIATGGVLLAICIVGFLLSIYLCVGLAIAAARRH
jgi:hypothetical protein